MHLGSSEKALNFLGYVTLEKRHESHVCNLVKKCLSNRCPQFFMHYFNCNRDILLRKTRSSDKLRLFFNFDFVNSAFGPMGKGAL